MRAGRIGIVAACRGAKCVEHGLVRKGALGNCVTESGALQQQDHSLVFPKPLQFRPQDAFGQGAGGLNRDAALVPLGRGRQPQRRIPAERGHCRFLDLADLHQAKGAETCSESDEQGQNSYSPRRHGPRQQCGDRSREQSELQSRPNADG
jgi:hypothetical protein